MQWNPQFFYILSGYYKNYCGNYVVILTDVLNCLISAEFCILFGRSVLKW